MIERIIELNCSSCLLQSTTTIASSGFGPFNLVLRQGGRLLPYSVEAKGTIDVAQILRPELLWGTARIHRHAMEVLLGKFGLDD